MFFFLRIIDNLQTSSSFTDAVQEIFGSVFCFHSSVSEAKLKIKSFLCRVFTHTHVLNSTLVDRDHLSELTL